MSEARHQYTIADLRSWEKATRGLHPSPLLGVLGDPVAHSASPPMHTAALRFHEIDASYVRLHIHPEELPEAIGLLRENRFIGVNLTIPHKAAVIPLLEQVDPKSSRFGVVNTVAFQNGTARGFNTDGEGLARAIKSDFGQYLKDLRVLIVGAGGGAGRAVAIQCAAEGCPAITLVNRTLSKAREVEAETRNCFIKSHGTAPRSLIAISNDNPALPRVLANTDLIIQCSSVGMLETDPSPLPESLIAANHLVYDTIYSRETRLIKRARELGASCSNGLSMLLHQGALAFEIWFPGKIAPLDLMKDALLRATTKPTH